MNIKLEILAGVISDAINAKIRYMDIDADSLVDSAASNILNDIACVIRDSDIENDFDVVEEIVTILEKNNIDVGERHNF